MCICLGFTTMTENHPIYFTCTLKYSSLHFKFLVCIMFGLFIYLFFFFLASYRLPVHTCQWLWFPWQCVWKHNVGTRQNWLGGDHFGWGHMRRLAHSGYHSPWLKHVFKSRKSPRRFIMASGVMFFSGCRSSANLWCIDLIINALNLINFNDYQNTQCVTRAASDISQLYHCNSEINSLNEALNW